MAEAFGTSQAYLGGPLAGSSTNDAYAGGAFDFSQMSATFGGAVMGQQYGMEQISSGVGEFQTYQTLQGGNQLEYMTQMVSVPEVQMVPVQVQEMQMVPMPVQEMQVVQQVVQMPVQEVQMVPVQAVQQVQMVYAVPAAINPTPVTPPPHLKPKKKDDEKKEPPKEQPKEKPRERSRLYTIPLDVARLMVKTIEVPVERVIEEVRDKVVEVPKYKEQKIVEELIEVDKPVVKEVPVEKIIQREVPFPVEKINRIDKIIEVERVLVKEVPLMVPVMKKRRERAEPPPPPPQPEYVRERLVPVVEERRVEKQVPVPIEKRIPVPHDRIVEVPREQRIEVPIEIFTDRARQVPVEKIIEVPRIRYIDRPVERFVDVPIEVPVETIIEKRIEVPVDRIVEKHVEKERASPPPESSRKHTVGVGLSLERRDYDNVTFVERIIPGFAADKSGQFAVGDIVVAVDDTPVQGMTLDSIKNLTIGQEGTLVTLHMLRGDQPYSVTVQRQMPAFVNDRNSEAQAFLVDRVYR